MIPNNGTDGGMNVSKQAIEVEERHLAIYIYTCICTATIDFLTM